MIIYISILIYKQPFSLNSLNIWSSLPCLMMPMLSKKRGRFDGGVEDKTCDQSDGDRDGQDFISKRRGQDKELMYKKESSSSSSDFSRSPSPARNRERAEDRAEQTRTADDPKLMRFLEAGLREKEYQGSYEDKEERRERLDEDSESQRAGSVSDIFESCSYGAVQSSANLLADIISSSDFGHHSLYKMLGYFSPVGLFRLHSLLGDYFQAI